MASVRTASPPVHLEGGIEKTRGIFIFDYSLFISRSCFQFFSELSFADARLAAKPSSTLLQNHNYDGTL